MSVLAQPTRLAEIEDTPLRDVLHQDSNWQADLSYCMSCGKCLSVCPLHGYSDWDPRRVVRMVLLGLEQEVVDADFIYQCTTCDPFGAAGACANEEACHEGESLADSVPPQSRRTPVSRY